VAPGDPLLTHREVGYWPDVVEKMAFDMVVVRTPFPASHRMLILPVPLSSTFHVWSTHC
jgi:hypothetical protein